MKKEMAALAVLLLLFAGSMYNYHYLENLTEEIRKNVVLSYESMTLGNTEKARESLESAIDRWQDAEGYTHIFIRHSEIDSTSEAMFTALSCIGEADAEEYCGAYRHLLYRLDDLLHMEKINPGSIF